MDRIVRDDLLLRPVPPTHLRAAQSFVAALPEDWDSVVAEPQFERGRFIGMGVHFHRLTEDGEKYVAFILGGLRVLTDAYTPAIVRSVNRAFEKAAQAA